MLTVSGLQLTMIVLLPSLLNSLRHPTAHQSNSTELPIRYTPEPNYKKKLFNYQLIY